MRAGNLDRVIEIQTYGSATPDDMGTAAPGWTPKATMRAQLVTLSTDEYIRGGAVDEAVAIFRTRWLADVTTADRVSYEGRFYNLKQVKEIGRREGLELRCEVIS